MRDAQTQQNLNLATIHLMRAKTEMESARLLLALSNELTYTHASIFDLVEQRVITLLNDAQELTKNGRNSNAE